MARERAPNPWAGPRLPIGPPEKKVEVLCFRCTKPGAIRFDLLRYDRRVGQIRLCGPCVLEANPPLDPLTVTEIA